MRNIFIFPTCYCLLSFGSVMSYNSPNVAIIGGGVGGTTAAYHIRKAFDEDEPRIDIYEAQKIGGRVATVEIAGRKYEAGASILHHQNKYMYDFIKAFGLRMKDRTHSKMGLYDGQQYVFKESDWNAVTVIRLLWRYGISLIRLDSEINSIIEKFSRIYDLQEKSYSFTTVQDLLAAMDPSMVNMTKYTAKEALLEMDFSDRFIDELALGAMRVNYGQTYNINALVGFISLAGAQPGLWSVYGGNDQVPVHLSEAAQSNTINSWVREIILKDGKFEVRSQNEVDINNNDVNANITTPPLSSHIYDIVVIATPLIDGMSDIKFTGFPEDIKNFPGRYHRTVATFVHGELNWPAVGLHEGEVDDIITINTDLKFNSISAILPIDYTKSSPSVPKVYKVFSQKPLSKEELDRLFMIRHETKVIDWLAYPHYIPPDILVPFKLARRLYYTSGAEWGGSCMEMSAIAGRNVALLAHNEWVGWPERVNKLPKGKDEL